MDKNQKALLLSMSIGDGSIGLRKNHKGEIYTGHLGIIHSEKQSEYLEYKRKILQSIFGGKEIKTTEFKPKVGYRASRSYRIGKANRYFRLIHRWLYSNDGKKFFTRKFLDKLTPQGIAIWYMDDGCGKKTKRKDGTVSSVSCHLSTYCTEEEADCIINYFKETWGITWKKRFHKRPGMWYLECNTKESRKLDELIRPYIIPSMEYKLPSYYSDTSAEPYIVGDDMIQAARKETCRSKN